jgi:transposase
MSEHDGRSLGREAQVVLRKRAVDAVLGGMKQCAVASAYGVSPEVVCRWMRLYREAGPKGLEAHRKGPAPGTGRLLSEKQSAEIRKLVLDRCPEQLKLPYALWTREAVRDLVSRRFGIRLAVRTTGNYLRDWGFTPQKPVRRAYEQSPKAVREWLDEVYPALAKRAKQEKAVIYWADEMGLRSDHQVGRSYGLRGQTPAIPATGKRFHCSMISAVTNQGHLCFRVFEGSFNVKLFTDFLRRLMRQAKRKVYLIVDGHPVHRAKLVQKWRAEHAEEMEIFYLPSYSPELNPDEMLNQDVKTNVSRHNRPTDPQQMKTSLRSYLFSTQRQPHIVRSYFNERHVRYAMPIETSLDL